MSLNRTSRVPGVPTLPRGEQIAAYPTYLEAQKAVDHLSDKEFPVQHVTIVGADLKMVERVTGRLTYSRVALAGLASGAWFGLFVGLLLSLFSGAEQAALPILPAVAIGAAFGILFSVISYALTGGKRDFTSSSQIVASSYAILCAAEHAAKARTLLATLGATTGPVVAPAPMPAPTDAVPPQAAPPQGVPPQAAPPQAAPPQGAPTQGAPTAQDPTPHPDAPPTQPPAGPQS